jgi:serine/threonine-protein kinase RsbW
MLRCLRGATAARSTVRRCYGIEVASGASESAVGGERLKFSITNDLAELPRVAEMIERFCAERAIAGDCAFALNVVLEELLSNTIFYGYDDDASHSIAIALAHEDCEVSLELSDDARPFDPLSAPPPDLDAPLEERRIGGLGIHLVKEMMDSIEYKYCDGRNHLRLRKRIGSPKLSSPQA